MTDDQDMVQLADTFGIKVMSTLGLLKIMLDCGHINRKLIDGIVEYWKHTSDVPANFQSGLRRFFQRK